MDEETKATLASMEANAMAAVRRGTAWLTSEQLAQKISADRGHCIGTMSRWVDERRLFAVEMDGQHLYPAYAFDAAGEPLPVIKRVLENLPDYDGFSLACWFESTNAYLDGSRPRDLLVIDAERVVSAAEAQRNRLSHG